MLRSALRGKRPGSSLLRRRCLTNESVRNDIHLIIPRVSLLPSRSSTFRIQRPSDVFLLGSLRRQIRLLSAESTSVNNIATQPSKSDENLAKKALFRGSPLWEVEHYYKTKHNIKNTVKLFKYEVMSDPTRGTLWTASFVCPESGRTFRSGIFRPEWIHNADGKTIVGADHVFEVPRGGKSIVYYPRKSTATNATAARVLDTLRFEADGVLEPRLCDEEPVVQESVSAERSLPTQALVHPPLQEIKQFYDNEEHGLKTPLSELMNTTKMVTENGTKWTAHFTCPISNKVFRSGVLRSGLTFPGLKQGDDFRMSIFNEGTDSEERTVYYGSKGLALNAVSARALDFFHFEKSKEKEPRMCEEDPSSGHLDVTSIDSTVKHVTNIESLITKSISQKSEVNDETAEDDEGEQSILFRNSPLSELDIVYTESGFEQSISSLMESEMKDKSGFGSVWTSQYTCPKTDRVFQAGTLRPEAVRNTFLEDEKTFEIADSRVFYQKKGVAIQAAAARALDVWRFEKNGTLEPRLCREDPLDEKSGLLDQEDKDDSDTSDEEKTKDQDETLDIEISDSPVLSVAHETLKTKNLASTSIAKDQNEESAVEATSVWDYSDDSGEDLVVYQVPSASEQSPAVRLLSEFATVIDEMQSSAVQYSIGSNITGSTIVHSEVERIRSIEAKALAWIDFTRQREASSTLHAVYLPGSISSNNRVIAKSLLSSLAEANLGCVIPHSTQGTAQKILSFLISADKASKPDTEIHNLYLLCLEGSDPVTRAIKAESIVERMKNQALLQGSIPAQPNSKTYNTLIGIWAQVGGVNGRYAKLDDSFEPNRESFLAILSSSSYGDKKADIFDTDFAKQCIERMKKIHELSGDPSMKPDVQICNAPLKWSGGLLWNKTRPLTRRISWDDYKKMYSSGFIPFSQNDHRIENAEKVEAWVEGMAEFGVSPNIESYEAVIQAWAGTGTREGLEKAEAILYKIPDDVSIRIQTLHPILAAWLHAKDKDSASRIRAGVDYLRAKDQSGDSEVEKDVRVLCLEIATNILQQDFMEKGTLESIADGFELPRRSVALIKKLAEQIREAPVEEHSTLLPLIAGPAMLTITAWGRAISNLRSDPISYQVVLDAMFEVVDLYEQVLKNAATKEAMVSNWDVAARNLSDEMHMLTAGSPDIYYCLVSHIHDISEEWSRSTADSAAEENLDILSPYVVRLERLCRRLQEMDEIKYARESRLQPSSLPQPTQLVFADRFDYQFSSMIADSFNVNRASLPWRMLDILQRHQQQQGNQSGSISPHSADVVRFCQLLKEMGPKGRDYKSNFEQAIDQFLTPVNPLLSTNDKSGGSILSAVNRPSNNPRTKKHAEKSRSAKAKDTVDSMRRAGRRDSQPHPRGTSGNARRPRKRLLKRSMSVESNV